MTNYILPLEIDQNLILLLHVILFTAKALFYADVSFSMVLSSSGSSVPKIQKLKYSINRFDNC